MLSNSRNVIRAGSGLCILIPLVLASLVSTACAAWLPGGLPVCTAPGYQGSLVSAPDGLGGMLLVWQDHRNAQLKVYAQRVDADGNLLWQTDGVLVGYDPSFHPWICGDGSGGAYVVWSNRATGYGSIFVQHLDASGSPMWAPAGIIIAGGSVWSDNSLPVCARDGLGGVIVAWVQQYNPPQAQYQVVAQRMTSAGNLLWTSQGILAGEDIGQNQELDIVTDEPSNGAILGWVRTVGTGAVQRVDLSGTPRLNGTVGYNLGLVTTGSRVRVADRKRVNQGAYIMSRWRGGLFNEDFLRVTAIDSTGYTFWTRDVYGGGYTSPEPGNDFRLVDNGLLGVWCVWERIDGSGGGLGVYTQMLESDGTPKFGNPTRVSGGTTGNHLPDAAIQYPTWNILITWVDDSGSPSRLKYTYVDPSIGYAHAEVLVPGGYSSTRPCIVAQYASGSKPIISWVDERVGGGETDIYASGLETNGQPTHPNLVATAINPASEPGFVGSGLNSFFVKVKNTGTCQADSFWTTIYPNQASPPSAGDPVPPEVQPVHCAPLSAGDSVLAEVKITAPLTPQTWSMWGFADYRGQIEEFGQESDNIIEPRSYQWIALPNLRIAQVVLSNSSPLPGHYITATVKVKNDGYAAAGGFYIDYYENHSGAPAPGAIGDERHLVAGLAAGDSVSWTTTPVTSETFMQWTSYFRVDTENLIPEMNENDNLSGPYYVNWRIPPESGWPVSSGAGFHSSPAIANLDNDPMTQEIVVGCDDGKIYAWGPGGKNVPGWPVTLPDSIKSSPAVGDITGDYHNEVVVGCRNGNLYAYDYHGVKLWEYATGNPVNTTPALADFDNDGKLEIVFSSGGNLYALEGNGSAYSGSWPYFAGAGGTFTSPAVGDVDGNGVLEIAIIAHGYTKPVHSNVYLLRPNGTLYSGSWPVSVDTVIVADPVLGCLASPSNNLEIVAGGINAKMYAWRINGTMLWASPARASGMVETSAALVNLDRDDYLEIVASSRRYTNETPPFPPFFHWVGAMAGIDNAGSPIAGWPNGMGSWTVNVGAVPSPIAIGSDCEAIAGSPSHSLYSYDRSGDPVYGFPIGLGADVLASAAVGDIDGDGWCELVVAANNDSVRCYKLLSDNYPVDDLWWPMFRHDRARTGCYGFVVPTGVDERKSAAPAATCIRSIHPNPFNPATRITFDLSERSRVELSIYDVSGRKVAVLVAKEMEAGRHEVVWNGRLMDGGVAASGVYFCRLGAGGNVETRKMVLVR